MMTDPVADYLTRIRNASMANIPSLVAPYSRLREDISKILKNEGFISDFSVTENEVGRKSLNITLAYSKNAGQEAEAHIRTIKRISRPGRRVYVNHKNIPRPLRGLGTIIISTSSGIITGKEAYSKRLGGEIVCEVW